MVFGWGKKRSTDSIESSQLVKQISLDKIEVILQNDGLCNVEWNILRITDTTHTPKK